MAKKKGQDTVMTKELRGSIFNLNKLAKNVLSLANGSNNGERDNERDQLQADIDRVVKRELNQLSESEGKDFNTLLARHVTKDMRSSKGEVGGKFDIQEMFENESTGIMAHFQERYRNVNLQLEDLHIIRKQVKELDSAINITRDAILSSDDLTATVSRNITFGGGISDEDQAEYIRIIEKLEEEYDIPKKLKNHIVPNSLTYGNYYAYTVPYSEIFSKVMYDKLKDPVKMGGVKKVSEAFTEAELENVLESFNIKDKESKEGARKYLETANSLYDSVSVVNDNIPIPLLEGSLKDMVTTLSEEDIKRYNQSMSKKDGKMSAVRDNVKADGFDENDKQFDFSEFTGVHFELLDPRKVIPIRIINKTIGYYYIHEEKHQRVRSPFTSNFNVDASLGTKDIESDFILKLSEKIIQDFDKSYLTANAEFKDTLINAITYHNIYGKDLKFQFIPAKYITEFPVNVDEKGNGQSILIDSLFYAKLYLALLIFKMISIIARSNDQRLYYIRTSGMDKNVANSVQSIARQMKQREVNFNDLLNYKSIVTKVGAGRDIYMPIGPEDIRGIDFETLGGQDVQLNTELMEMLKTSAINSTDVPSVMMQYINEADYARTLDMANARFANTTAGHQIDYNRSITELYRKIIKYSGVDIGEELISTFTYKLNTPASLQTTNLNTLINEVQQQIDFITRAQIGTNASPTELDQRAMDILFKRIARMRVGSIRWEAIESMMEDVYLEAKEAEKNKAKLEEKEE